MNLYRIKDWDVRYENNRTRELKRLDWVPIPNSHSGDGYTLTATQKNGAELPGSWLVIIQLASKCGKRGTLMRDTAAPHDAASISRISRISEASIKTALKWFSSDEVQWLEVTQHEQQRQLPLAGNQAPAGWCGIPAGGCLEGKGMEEKGITVVPTGETPPIPDITVEEIWQQYPNKTGKKKACSIIGRLLSQNPPSFGHELLAKVKAYAAAVKRWPPGDERYVPHPSTWLTQERFNDDPATWERKAQSAQSTKPDRNNFKTDDYSNLPT